MKHSVRKISIVGFGSAGASAAIALSRAGFKVDVFEQFSQIGPVGAGILIHPSGQLVLEKLKLLDEITSCSEKIEKILVRTKNGKTILDISYNETFNERSAYGVLRSNLFNSLYNAAINSGVNFHLGTEVHDIKTFENDSILISKDLQEYGPYDLVLLCDGACSRLREKIVSWSYSWRYSHGARWTLGSCSAVRSRLQQIVQGTRYLIGVLPTGGGRASFFWGTSPKEERGNFTQWRETALDFFPEAEELLKPLTSFNDLIETNYFQLFSSAPISKHVILLGDSWHAMSPHLGQGTNLALLDGYVLAIELSRFQGDLDAAKKEFLKHRSGNNKFYSNLSFMFSPFFQSGGWLKGELRDFFLPLIARVPWIRKQMVLTISGLKSGYFNTKEIFIP